VFVGLREISMFRLPGHSYRGPFLPLTDEERGVREGLIQHVQTLAGEIGERHLKRLSALERAAEYIERTFIAGGHAPRSQEYAALSTTVRNVEVECAGSTNEILIVGAHYDSVFGCPGANDNATGVAAVLELSRLSAHHNGKRTLRFVAFVNEEPPYFMTDLMGSVVYARRCRTNRENIFGMFSLETIGYYSDERGSQQYPGPAVFRMMYPDTGNFIAFVSNVSSRRLLRDAGRAFRRSTKFPSEGAAAPSAIPGIGWSDHWSFWEEGYAAVMLTDTAPYRYPHYHRPTDTPDKINYDALARVVVGLSRMFSTLADGSG
jgi:Zn-dependent M28 family amino/carboxypeptidase